VRLPGASASDSEQSVAGSCEALKLSAQAYVELARKCGQALTAFAESAPSRMPIKNEQNMSDKRPLS
jgi:hypothetical protein